MRRGHAPEDIVPRYLDELTGRVVGGGVTGEVILTCVCARMCVCVSRILRRGAGGMRHAHRVWDRGFAAAAKDLGSQNLITTAIHHHHRRRVTSRMSAGATAGTTVGCWR